MTFLCIDLLYITCFPGIPPPIPPKTFTLPETPPLSLWMSPTPTNPGWLPSWGQNPPSSPPKQRSLSPIKAPAIHANSLKLRSSLASLAAPASNWLSWAKNRPSFDENSPENAIDDEAEDRQNDPNDGDTDASNDEVDDHVTDRKKSSSSWGFWNSGAGAESPQNPGAGAPSGASDAKQGITNTILNATPSFATKLDTNSAKNARSEGKNDEESETKDDDAVLYKPHDNARQFSKIDTHKNENLRQNIIVPDWNLCLPNQSSSGSTTSSIASSLFGSSSTANLSAGASSSLTDVKNWRNFISQLLSKLGFSLQSLTSVVESGDSHEGDDSKDALEKEFNLLYERTYRLYGRSLAKLPAHKRACLPNYNKFYTRSTPEEGTSYKYDQQTQQEEDEHDVNAISITNDPMGNLLINHKPHRHVHPTVNPSDIISHKSGSLQKIKKILIIGVHGFFPTKMIRPIIGSPKGTSLKFASEAEKAVIRYCIDNGLIDDSESNHLSIQKIALEKEGKIFDRVKFFTEILVKWRKELNEADFIYIASHSQGCVVSIILMARLIKLGILVDPIRKRIGILGMAGINNGPFYGVDKSFFMKAYSAIEHDSMMELFELTKFDSQQSLVYKQSVQIIVNANVKLCFIGSINDQLVPLYSALASHTFHPNIYRACYIDHSSQTPDFIQRLVSLCCQLQNLGFFDNNVLKELSLILAGTMTSGGHSKIYNDGKVYDLGIKFFLDTDDMVIPPTTTSRLLTRDLPSIDNLETEPFVNDGIDEIVKIPATNQVYVKEYNIGKIGTNPFILPWCLRGLIFNIEKNWPNNNKLITVENGKDLGKSGYDEINDLYELFEAWRPESKILKDLKFRLNGIRASKL